MIALEGGRPVRKSPLPYGRQSVSDEDAAAVLSALRSDWLTTGPVLDRFEAAFARATGSRHAVALSNGTAALHAAMVALGVGPGDEVIVPTLTFVASANAAVFCGARPVFADVDPATLLVDPASVARKLTRRTKAVVGVDFGGQPCDFAALRRIARKAGAKVLADACHSLGASRKGAPVGSLADMTAFSFHPVKHITSGEGGAVTTDDAALAQSLRRFRNHGIDRDHRDRMRAGAWSYDMTSLGYNYRLTEIQAALALSQLSRLKAFVARRRRIAARYDRALRALPGAAPLATMPGNRHSYHLYVVRLDPSRLTAPRDVIFEALRAEGIGVNVHYWPVHLHTFYRSRFKTAPGLCPHAEEAARHILSLPIFPGMSDQDAADVVTGLARVLRRYAA